MKKLTDLEVDELISELNTVYTNMERHGGNFEHALSKVLMFSDLNNVRKIKAAFPDEWEKFLNWNKQ